ncbi:MAG: lipoprotein [Proteobacteria bacterium]|nr:lipoprotein [Pseudomonadota bacterium]
MLHSKALRQTCILIVKSTSHLLCIVAASLLLSACGQRGPLYLPTPPAPATPTQTHSATTATPAATSTTQSSAPATK